MFAFIKNRGGVGRSLSRQETAERLNPLLDRHNRLMYAYDHVIERLSDREAASSLDRVQPTSRTDISKLSETVVSNAGTPPLGTDIRPQDLALGNGDAELLDRLKDMEMDYHDALRAELKLRHHMRTLAILKYVLTNSNERLELLSRVSNEVRRQAPARS